MSKHLAHIRVEGQYTKRDFKGSKASYYSLEIEDFEYIPGYSLTYAVLADKFLLKHLISKVDKDATGIRTAFVTKVVNEVSEATLSTKASDINKMKVTELKALIAQEKLAVNPKDYSTAASLRKAVATFLVSGANGTPIAPDSADAPTSTLDQTSKILKTEKLNSDKSPTLDDRGLEIEEVSLQTE